MTDTEIQNVIFDALRAIAPEADPRTLRPHDDLRQTLDIDSFDYLNLLIGLHKRLGVEIPEADYGQLTTLGSMVAYLSLKLSATPGRSN
jgi:acyl carrier protein